MAKTKTMTIQSRVESALLNGEALTSTEKIDLVLVNQVVIQVLRFDSCSTLTKELVLKYTE